MSLSVSGSNATNPFASLQSLWQQASSASGASQSSSDPVSALLSALNQNGAGGAAVSPTNGINASGATSGGTATQSSSPQFGPQTLQALLALQSNGANAQTLASALDSAGNNPLAALGGQSSQGSHSHHRHHHGADGASDSGSATSGAATSNPSGGSAAGNNLQQLLQMQAALVGPAGSQNTITA
jgi:hypothetical protein